MARLPRLAVPLHLHLWTQRGAGGHPVFKDDQDHASYLDAVKAVARDHGIAIHAYALLPSRVLLLLTPQTSQAMSRFTQAHGRQFGAAYNKRHGRSGVLWESRFRSTLVDADAHWLDCMRYVECAPVVEGLAGEASRFAWSSASHHLGVRRLPWLTECEQHWLLGNTPFERESAYRRALETPLSPTLVRQIDHCVSKGWILGGDDFARQMSMKTKRALVPRKPGRPKKTGPKLD